MNCVTSGAPWLCLLCVLAVAAAPPARAQNVVLGDDLGATAAPLTVSAQDTMSMIRAAPDFEGAVDSHEANRVAARLEAHVAAFVAGFPYLPFHNTLGISGYETYFDHPDHLFYALSIALPHLSPRTAAAARRFLASQLKPAPPYAVDGFDRKMGQPRESYDVPPELRVAGRGQASSAFGVYAFWAYQHYAADAVAAHTHWAAVRARLQPLLNTGYTFALKKQDYTRDEAQKLNGDLAGLIGCVRLARINGDTATEQPAVARAQQLLQLRINVERENPKILEPTNSTSKHLHAVKLARYCDLVPEVGEAVRKLTDGTGTGHLEAFREARNGWYLAFGERMIGGENYTNPPHFSHALFNGAIFIEQLSPAQLLSFVDLPWCKGDFYFMEKCTHALWSSSGGKWISAGL